MVAKSKVSLALVALVIITSGLALYWPTLSYSFVYDDHIQIVNNPLVVGFSSSSIAKIFVEPTFPGNLYRPVTTLSFGLTSYLFGITPLAFHLLNVLLHISVTLLVFTLSRRLQFSALISSTAALLFLLHPLHTEAVANVTGRAELLVALFGLGSVIIATSSIQTPIRLFTALLLFFLATLSKESGFVFALLIPLSLYQVSLLRKESSPKGTYAVFIVAIAAASALSLLLRYNALGQSFLLGSSGQFWMENPIFHLSFSERLYPALVVLGEMLSKIIIPSDLSADYSMMWESFAAVYLSVTGSLHLIPIFFILLGALLIGAPAPFLALWFFVALLLTANIITPIGTITAERLYYTPSIGIVLLVNFGLSQILLRHRGLYQIATGILMILLAFGSIARMSVWESDRKLFQESIADNPRSPKALYNYAALLTFGTKDERREAKRYLTEALRLNPTHIPSLKLMTEIARRDGDAKELRSWLLRVNELSPNDEEVLSALKKLNELEEIEETQPSKQ